MNKIYLSFLFLCFFSIILPAQEPITIKGRITVNSESLVSDGIIDLIDNKTKQSRVVNISGGVFVIQRLIQGNYTIKVSVPDFGLYENKNFKAQNYLSKDLIINLVPEVIKEEVLVEDQSELGANIDSNNNDLIIKGSALDSLPDDPEELQAYLQALAGPIAGPDGGQAIIDGFTGGRFPPKEIIREIRINSNPFSAEFDRMGFSRIEILTKPGLDKFRGSSYFNFNDESLNSRNPFALNRAPSQTRNFGGYLSGPIKTKKSSFFLDTSSNQTDKNSIVTATSLDNSLNIVNINQDFRIPTRRFSISPRVDYQINDYNNFIVRYSFSRSNSENQGVYGFSLPTRGYSSQDTLHNIQITESYALNPRTVNETRIQYEYLKREQNGDNSIPTINVYNAFIGGGSQIGLSYNKAHRWEFQNYTTTSYGENYKHSIKFGLRVRNIKIEDRSESGYGGSFSFNGVRNPRTGEILYSSIEQYRQKILGNPDPIFNPTQFSLTAGNPVAGVSQYDYGLFFTDDWRIRTNLTINAGLRYERQNNITDQLNFAPRIGFAWAPFTNNNKPKIVTRGAAGIFYDRFNENTTLRANRNDGISQLQYIVTDSNILGQAIFSRSSVRNVPTVEQLKSLIPLSNTPFRVANDLQAPYSIQSIFSFDYGLPMNTTISTTLFFSRSLHTLRQRNINAPVCPSPQICPTTLSFQQLLLLRPEKTKGNIYQVESSGNSNTHQLLVKITTRLNPKITFFGNYTLSFSQGMTDSVGGANISTNMMNFPAYGYDLSGEYAPSSLISKHHLFFNGTISLPFKLQLSPILAVSTGRRFNIVTGLDTNRDSVFTERPTYAELFARCLGFSLKNNFCNMNIADNSNETIPRNYGKSPGGFVLNMSIYRTFDFGKTTSSVISNRQKGNNSTKTNRQHRFASRQYKLTLGINIQNILNRVNLGAPQNNLSSPFFGQSIGISSSSSYNRRIDLSVRFNF